MIKLKIKKGDLITVIKGKDNNKTGKILKVFPETGRILVEGINLYKKNVKPKKQGEKGQIISVPRSINISNVQLVCPSCGIKTRVGYIISEKKEKNRICRKCKASI